MSREVVVVSAVRTAIGTFGGSLKDIPPHRLWPPRWCANPWPVPTWKEKTWATSYLAMW